MELYTKSLHRETTRFMFMTRGVGGSILDDYEFTDARFGRLVTHALTTRVRGRLIAVALLKKEESGGMFLAFLTTAPRWRRKGVCSELVERMRVACSQDGGVHGKCETGNAAARAFWEAQGCTLKAESFVVKDDDVRTNPDMLVFRV